MSSSCVRENRQVGVSASVLPPFVVVLLERTEMEVTDSSQTPAMCAKHHQHRCWLVFALRGGALLKLSVF